MSHDPNAIPTVPWRMLAEVTTTLNVQCRELVIRVTSECFTKLTDRFLEAPGAVVLHPFIKVAHNIHNVGKGVVRVVIEHLINRDWLSFSLHHDLVDVANTVSAPQAGIGMLAQ